MSNKLTMQVTKEQYNIINTILENEQTLKKFIEENKYVVNPPMPTERKVSPFDRVEKGENYFYIGYDGQLEIEQDMHVFFDDKCFKIGNYCTDKKLLQQHVYKETLNRLLWRFSMMNGGDKIDWADNFQQKWFIFFDTCMDEWDVLANEELYEIGKVYFYSDKIAEKAIEEIVLPFVKEHPDFKLNDINNTKTDDEIDEDELDD